MRRPASRTEWSRELELVALEIEPMTHERRLVEVRRGILKQNDLRQAVAAAAP